MWDFFGLLFLANLLFVLGFKLEEVYHCNNEESSTQRILLISPQENYLFDRIIQDFDGKLVPEQNNAGQRFKSSDHLLTVTGKLQGDQNCITIIETPQMFSPMSVIDVAEEISQRCFQKILVAIQPFTQQKPLRDIDEEIMISILGLLESTYHEDFWDKLEFVFITQDKPDQSTIKGFKDWTRALETRIHGGKMARKRNKIFFLTPNSIPSDVIIIEEDVEQCSCWELYTDSNFFSKSGITWIGNPSDLVTLPDQKVEFQCYLLTDNFDDSLFEVRKKKNKVVNKSRVDWKVFKERNDLKRIQVTLDQPATDGPYKCVYNHAKPINSFQVTIVQSRKDIWSEWSSWTKCEDVDHITERKRSKGDNTHQDYQTSEENSIENHEPVDAQVQRRICTCEDLAHLPNPRILLLGPTGVGKSTLGNQLLGGHKAFALGHNFDSKTEYISFTTSNLVGTGQCITIIDTPGAKDSKGRDYKHTLEMQKLLKNEIKSFDVILLLVHGGNTRFDAGTIELIKWYEAVFGIEMWKNVIIEITFWPHSNNSRTQRWLDRKVTEDSVSKDLTSRLHNELQVPDFISVPILFIDPVVQIFADPCHPQYRKPEEEEKLLFKKYLERLMNESSTFEPFDCKSRCQAPDEFYSGLPWVSNVPNNTLYLDPGVERIIEWQIWEGVQGNASAEYKITFDDELIYEKKDKALFDYTQIMEAQKSEYSVKIRESKILMKVASIKLYLTLNPLFEVETLSRTVSLSNSVADELNSTRSVQILVSKDAFFKPWGQWSTCSVTCLNSDMQYGERIRKRICQPEVNKGKPCSVLLNNTSVSSENENYYVEEIGVCAGDNLTITFCPEQLSWSSWSFWGSCSVDCGQGTESRSRRCLDGNYGGEVCENEFEVEDRPCFLEPECPKDCVLSEWESWSSCSSSCIGMFSNGSLVLSSRIRMKSVVDLGNEQGKECSLLASEEIEHCSTVPPCPVDGIWSEWSSYGSCSAQCGPATKSRFRSCIGPLYGGMPCQGEDLDTLDCNNQPCEVNCEWSDWETWSECSLSCRTGQRTRFRDEEDQGNDVIVKPCKGSSFETENCNQMGCAVDGKWSLWSESGMCSTSCGQGVLKKSRYCIGPFNAGMECQGLDQHEVSCNNGPCPVDCEYSEWDDWSTCAVSCGSGMRKRERYIEVEESHGGRKCRGATSQQDICHLLPCPVDGVWTEWLQVAPCTTTCGRGTVQMERQCMGSTYGGNPCYGPPSMSVDCKNEPCPIDCEWDEWQSWSRCTVTCGYGSQTRSRSVLIPASLGGRNCRGGNREDNECFHQTCQVPQSGGGSATDHSSSALAVLGTIAGAIG